MLYLVESQIDGASPIAQLVQRAPVNLKVAGCNPAGRATVVECHAQTLFEIYYLVESQNGCASPIAQLVERAAVNLKVAGSNPAGEQPL